MPDDTATTSRTLRREQALAAARRRLRLLEIETHRIKAELARLEAENEDDIADELSGELGGVARRAAPGAVNERPRSLREARRSSAFPPAPGDAPTDASPASNPPLETNDRTTRIRRRAAERRSQAAVQFAIETDAKDSASPTGRVALARKTRQRSMPAAWSLGVHAAVLVLCLSWTFPVLMNNDVPLLASSIDVTVEPLAVAETPVEIVTQEEFALQDVPLEETALNLAESLTNDLVPLDDSSAAELAATLGQLDSLPSDLGTLMVGAGSGGEGQGGGLAGGGQLGTAMFFGTQSRGNRFVFLVDNSSSMKGGRLEAAIAELQRSVAAMTRRQSFYVIFVSDQTYPMFYPQPAPQLLPATEPNKRQLREWLTKVTLASGKNRELIKAMDMAAALRPEAVFFLWDGDLPHEGVRRDVMEYLTRPNGWPFAVHTLGMGVDSIDAEQYLAAIALAHGGTYRRIPVDNLRQNR